MAKRKKNAKKPNYETMGKGFLVAVKDRTGSSTIATKIIKHKYGGKRLLVVVSRHLKKFAESGKLVRYYRERGEQATMPTAPEKKAGAGSASPDYETMAKEAIVALTLEEAVAGGANVDYETIAKEAIVALTLEDGTGSSTSASAEFTESGEQATMPRTPANDAGAGHANPDYPTMAEEAIFKLRDRTGHSKIAIAKFILHKYGEVLPENYKEKLSRGIERYNRTGELPSEEPLETIHLKSLTSSEADQHVRCAHRLLQAQKTVSVAARSQFVHELRKAIGDFLRNDRKRANAGSTDRLDMSLH
eukprot:CAMPEP_0197492590 /NCGR_PEP_ID=MMETSP1311-20131121/11472_1 /TAXON_ID=464262 /ORGANISM="Genus nov. species nov., Strain RCC856" /LENGTH=303 /DNA_ID=CAMNT_0043037591 /DNA_START=122 /DNA_END=1035 /DNA_ORIENTATION=-